MPRVNSLSSAFPPSSLCLPQSSSPSSSSRPVPRSRHTCFYLPIYLPAFPHFPPPRSPSRPRPCPSRTLLCRRRRRRCRRRPPLSQPVMATSATFNDTTGTRTRLHPYSIAGSYRASNICGTHNSDTRPPFTNSPHGPPSRPPPTTSLPAAPFAGRTTSANRATLRK